MWELDTIFSLKNFKTVPEAWLTEEVHPGHQRALPRDGAYTVREYINWVSESTQGNAGFHILAGLSMISSLIPPHIHIPDGDQLHANLFVMLVGPSGLSKKTYALEQTQKLLVEVDPNRELYLTLASPQAVLEEIQQFPQRIIFVGEGDSFFSHMQRGSYGDGLRAALMNLYDCQSLSLNTIASKGRRKLAQTSSTQLNPRVSMGIACAPEHIIENVLRRDFTGGFMGRMAMCYGLPERIKDAMPPVNTVVRERLKNHLNNLIVASGIVPGDSCKGYTAEALDYFRAWSAARPTTTTEIDKPLIDRADVLARKMALILAYDRHTYPYILNPTSDAETQGLRKPWHITWEDMRVACSMATASVASARFVGQEVCETEDAQAFYKVLRYTKEKPRTLQEMQIYMNLKNREWQAVFTTLRDTHRLMPNREGKFVTCEDPSLYDVGNQLALPPPNLPLAPAPNFVAQPIPNYIHVVPPTLPLTLPKRDFNSEGNNNS
jgi:hypothetical protein